MKNLKPIRSTDCLRPVLLACLGLFLWTTESRATLRTWSGAGADNNWLTSGNWDALPAVNNDSLTFAGTTRQNNTNNFTAITNTAITFNNGGWILNGSNVWLGGNITSTLGTNVMNMNTPLTAARTVTVTADQLTMNGILSGAFGLTKAGVGTLILNGTNTHTGGTTIPASTGIVRITNPKGLGTGSVSIPRTGATTSGYLQIDIPGVNTIANAFGGFSSANSGEGVTPQIENLSGTNTITSNLIVTGTGGNGLVVKATGGLLILAGTEGSTQASRNLNLNGNGNGLVTGAITNGTAGTSAYPVLKNGTGTWTLAGTNIFTGAMTIANGTLALGANGSISNATPVLLSSGTTFDVSALTSGWFLNSGKQLQGAGVIKGNVTANTSSFIVPGLSSAPTTTTATLTFSNNLTFSGGLTLQFNLSSDPTGVTRPSDQVVVNGNLTATGVNTFSLGSYVDGYIPNGTYKLIKFNGALTGDASNFAVSGFTVGLRGSQGGYIVTNIGSIDLVVTGTPPANLVWKGDGSANNWDIQTTTNWLNGVTPDAFFNFDAVTLNDSSTNFLINISATVTPGSLTVNSTNNYSFTDTSANITGVAGLTKLGSGTLTISNGNNSYTGVTTYGEGKIRAAVIGNGAAASSIGSSAKDPVNQFFNGGTLEYLGASVASDRGITIGANGGTISVADPNATLTFNVSGVFNANGNTFTKAGPGTLAWTFQQNLDGTNIIKGGVLKIPTVNLFSVNRTIPVYIYDGALDLNAQTLENKPIIVMGMGDLTLGATNGAIVNSGAAQTQALRFVTLTGDTAFGGAGRWDIRANPTASLSTGGNAYNLIKVGANQISLVGVTVDASLADIDLRSGILSYETGTTGLGNPANTLSVAGAATFQVWSTASALNKKMVLADNSTLISGAGANTILGSINLLGDTGGGPTVSAAAGTSLTINGVVSGAGNITKTGTGTVMLAGTNTYTGTTTVSAGKLVLNSAQTGIGNITVNDGTTFGVNTVGNGRLKMDTLTLGNGGSATTNEINSAFSTTTAPIYATNLVVNSPITVNIPSGNFLSGQTYPLIAFDSLSGGGSFTLGTLPPLVVATLIATSSNVALNVTSSTSIEIWSGAINNQWDLGATANWKLNGSAATFANGNNVQFDDTASNANVVVSTTVQPKSINVNNSTLSYILSGSSINSTGSVTKLGSAAMTINNANAYSGGTVLSAGTLNINNNGALGTGPLTINAGTIDNNGSGAVTLTNNNAQIWNANINYTGNQDLNVGVGAVTMNANQVLAINGSTLTVGGSIYDGGNNYSMIKNGAGNLILGGSNTYTGGLTVNVGTVTLQGNQSAATGSLIVGPASTDGGLNIASGSAVHIAPSNKIQVGNLGGSGTAVINVTVAGSVTNEGALQTERSSVLVLTNGANWLQSGDMDLTAWGGFSAALTVASNSVFNYTGANTIKLNGAEANFAQALLTVSGQFITPVAFEQISTPSTGYGEVILTGGGTLKLSASVADLTPLGGNAYSIQFITTGTGGTIDTAGFDTEITANLTGAGKLIKAGAGMLTLDSPSYTGNTVISAGVLALTNAATLASTNIVVSGGAKLDVSGLATPPLLLFAGQTLTNNSTTTATINGSIDASAGKLGLTYLAGTPTFAITNGPLTLADSNVVTINNMGAALTNGSYKLISGSVAGTAPAIVAVIGNGLGSGGTGTLRLAGYELYLTVSGVVSVNTNSPVLTNTISGNTLTLAWPTDHLGWRLEVQTNSLTSGLTTNWLTWPNSTNLTTMPITINPTAPTVFFRLVYP